MTTIATSTTSLTSLPEELLLHSFSFLNEKEIALIICRVNEVYKKMGNQEVLWEALTIKRYPVLSKSLKTQEITWKIFFQGLYVVRKTSPQKVCYWPCRNYHLTTYKANAYDYNNPGKPAGT